MKKQSGVMLLEALIAIFIFSLGILAVVGMQAMAAKQVNDAQYRSQASLLANQLFGAMWATDRTIATLEARFDSATEGAPGYAEWKDHVARALPNTDTNPPRVSIAPDGTALVEIQWLAPNDAAPHKYTAVAKIM